MRKSIGLGLVGACLLSACATVQSRPETTTSSLKADAAGLTYFLPQKLVKLTITRTPLDLAKLKKARDAAAADLEAATKDEGEKKDIAEHAQDLLDKLAADAAARPDQEKASELAAADLALADAAVDDAKAAFDKASNAYIAVLGGDSPAGCTYDAKLELQPSQADPRRRYVAVLRHNWMRDDTVKLAVTPAGLLTSANIVAVDRTGDIIVEAAGAIAGLGPAGSAPRALLSAGTPGRQDQCGEPRKMILLFDPADSQALDEIATRLNGADYPFRVGPKAQDEIMPLDEIQTRRSAAAPAEAATIAADSATAQKVYAGYRGALFYRSAVPVALTLERNVDERWHIVDSAMVMLPQAGPISYIPANASAFVKTVDDVVFVDGMIASWSPDRPSEVLEIVRLPVKVATAIISVPAQLLSLRVDYSSKAKSLADNQAAEMAAQRTLLTLRKCLADAQANGTDGTTCLPAAK